MFIVSVVLMVFMVFPVVFGLIFMPYFTRETVSFGVMVSEETFHSDKLRNLRKQYALLSAVIYLLIITLSILSGGVGKAPAEIVYPAGIIGIVACSLVLNLIFHFKMKKIKAALPPVPVKQPQTLALDTSFRRRKLALSNRWFLIHGIVTVISAAWALNNYDQIPGKLAMKFNLAGEVTRYADKSILNALFPNIMQIVLILVFAFVNWSIVASKQQLDPENPAESAARNAVFRRRWSFFNILSSFAIVLLFSFIQLNMILQLNPETVALVSILIPGLMVFGAAALMLTTGQGGSRVGPKRTPSASHPYDDDAHWKLGAVYFNPKDPAIFVEKRYGIGWTINYGQVKTWVILLGVIGIIVATTLLFV